MQRMSSSANLRWLDSAYRTHVHRIFDSLNPHTAKDVANQVTCDQWAQQLTKEEQDLLIMDVRSLDPDALSSN